MLDVAVYAFGGILMAYIIFTAILMKKHGKDEFNCLPFRRAKSRVIDYLHRDGTISSFVLRVNDRDEVEHQGEKIKLPRKKGLFDRKYGIPKFWVDSEAGVLDINKADEVNPLSTMKQAMLVESFTLGELEKSAFEKKLKQFLIILIIIGVAGVILGLLNFNAVQGITEVMGQGFHPQPA